MPGALLGAALYPLGLDGPVWIYVGAGIKFILWVARFIAAGPRLRRVHLRAFAPYALPFLALAVMSADHLADAGRSGSSAIPLALIGIVGATQGPRYDVIVAPSGDLAAVRDADGALEVVGKRFNAFAAEQWLTADGDGRDPASARASTRPATALAASPPCRRAACSALSRPRRPMKKIACAPPYWSAPRPRPSIVPRRSSTNKRSHGPGPSASSGMARDFLSSPTDRSCKIARGRPRRRRLRMSA